jgi:hypothetical protein
VVMLIQETQLAIDQARDIIETKAGLAGMTIGFDEDQYTLTGNEMFKIARALYLADCEINKLDLKTNTNG